MRIFRGSQRAPALLTLAAVLWAGPVLARHHRHSHRAARHAFSGRPEDDPRLKGDAKAFLHARVRFIEPADESALPPAVESVPEHAALDGGASDAGDVRGAAAAPIEGVRVSFSVEGYALGAAQPDAAPDAPRPHAHLIVDNDLALELDSTDSVVLQGLRPGPHALRLVLCRPWHEVVKAPGAFALTRFWLGPPIEGKAGRAAEFVAWPNPKKPILTYVLPLGDAAAGAPHLATAPAAAQPEAPAADGGPARPDAGTPVEAGAAAAESAAGASAGAQAPVSDAGAIAADAGAPARAARTAPAPHAVLDFYLSGAKLVRRGDKVRVVIDKREYPTLRTWKPVRLDRLRPGQHRITIDLLSRRGTKVRNAVNRTDRTFTTR